MAEQKPCVRCGRSIDSLARTCVYCNWDQELPPPTAEEVAATPAYIPPKEHRGRNRILAIIGFVALILGAFVVGSMLHGFEPKDAKTDTSHQSETARQAASASTAPSTHRSDVTLVPVAGGESISDDHGAMTSVPVPATASGGTTSTAEPTDATALPSQQYAAAAARAQAQSSTHPVDPRSIRGDVLQSAAASPEREASRKAPRRDPSMAMAQTATRPHSEPVPVYQPLPRIRVDRDSTARLYLTVGDDGRVKDIEVVQSVPGEMPKLISAVQDWRFRPALQDGQPVTASFTVNITFHANE